MGDLYIGTPKQKVSLMFDTGSAPIWVYDESKCGFNCPSRSDSYKSSKSSSFEYDSSQPDDQDLSYALGYVSGRASFDKVCFGDDDGSACLSKVQFLDVDSASGTSNYQSAGFVGLGPKTYREGFIEAFLPQIEAESEKMKPIFSFYFTDSTLKKGKLIFGGYDLEKFAKPDLTEKDIFWAPLEGNPYYWTVNMNDLAYAGKSVIQESRKLILDTGMSFSIIPEADMNLIVSSLEEHGVSL